MIYRLPIKTVTGLNAREHWTTRHRRVSNEKAMTALVIRSVPIPCTVTMTRLSASECDDDNLQGAMKAIRDQIAKTAGVDDGPRGPIKWAYAQEKVKRGEFGVLVRIEKAIDSIEKTN